jgi:hypothetical protein
MRLRTTALALALALLGACGGGGGGGGGATTPPANPTVSGTVAANAALAGYEMEVFPFTPTAGILMATTGANGQYSVTSTTPGLQGPFLIHALRPLQDSEPQYQRLYSLALRGGTAHATPLTDLLVARLLNRKLGFLADFREFSELRNKTDSDVSAARQQVVDYLMRRPSKNNGNLTSPVDVSAVTDFIGMPLTAVPGDPYFEALTRLHDSLMDSESIDGVEEHMLFGNDPPADLRTILDLDLLVNCTVEGNDDGTLPRGTTQVIVDTSGIQFGTINLPYQSGTQLNLTAGQSLDGRWRFNFPTQRTVEFAIVAGRVTSAVLSVPFQASRCSPPSAPSVAGKHPSLIALIGLFAQSIGFPAFGCSAPTVFFQDGTNVFVVDPNGAVRFNGPGGPTLHLPSLNIEINAPLVASGGPLPPLRLSTFSASRSFRGGFDALGVQIGSGPQITGLRLSRQQNGQLSQTQSCGII